MNRQQRQIVAVVAGVAIVVGVTMVVLGMEPNLVLVACIVAVLGTAALLIVDLALRTTPLNWYRFGTEADTSARPDRRVQVLRSRLRQSSRFTRPAGVPDHDDEPIDEIIESLLAAIDDHLDAEHGLDRATDAAAVADVLGADLNRFVNEPTQRRAMTRGRALARTVSSIEALDHPPAMKDST